MAETPHTPPKDPPASDRRPPRRSLFRELTDRYPPGLMVIVVLALVSSLIVVFQSPEEFEGIELWVFAQNHLDLYQSVIDEWNETETPPLKVQLIAYQALERRIMSAFFAGTPVADLVEVERGIGPRAWRGPLEAVGYTDLTDILHEEGLFEQINPPSFSPWISRGRIFGIPHDVHPVLLAYRADLLAEAGIDPAELTTWDRFFDRLAPLVQDFTGDGRPDRYLLELPLATAGIIEPLILQGGGALFNEDEECVLDSDRNAELLARMIAWSAGPDRLTADIPLYSESGNQLRQEGFVIAWIVPDWRNFNLRNYMPRLAGKMRLMPLPAWEERGRRTTAMGGTMLGIPRATDDFESAWRFAKHLYLSRDLARRQFSEQGIVTPVMSLWDDPVFDEPDAYFGGQAIGRLYIEQAPHVPFRSSSPYLSFASGELAIAATRLAEWAERNGTFDAPSLEAPARDFLRTARENIERQIRRNAFRAGEAQPQS